MTDLCENCGTATSRLDCGRVAVQVPIPPEAYIETDRRFAEWEGEFMHLGVFETRWRYWCGRCRHLAPSYATPR